MGSLSGNAEGVQGTEGAWKPPTPYYAAIQECAWLMLEHDNTLTRPEIGFRIWERFDISEMTTAKALQAANGFNVLRFKRMQK